MNTFSLTAYATQHLLPRTLIGMWCIINNTDLTNLAADIHYTPSQLSRFWKHRTPKPATFLQQKTGIALPEEAWSRTQPQISRLSQVLTVLKPTLTKHDLLIARDSWLLLQQQTHEQLAAELEIPPDTFRRFLLNNPKYRIDQDQLQRYLAHIGLDASVQLSLFGHRHTPGAGNLHIPNG